ncbi:hypothetical protein GQ55_5G059500 [Panicum hallii var. hallii]|uniref:Uncharacterized protein n=1 Tax=Panicum hallii var. hallii TaxID=1504633 RepID=A0A2T7DD66_9POAL|nr:hypothetical protein GQ55_5G058900 [Panicum hallii var. hallii]PUZ53538.1 hypothetical protein GQ55_5G059300 [Panicum hallii var. hallii]PUZ53541.1 hypothetical protein GQ55_5G059500 [Panicum hallii var. hallii]
MEFKKPLLWGHQAQEGATAAAPLAGKLHGSDPGATASSSGAKKLEDLQLAALNAEASPSAAVKKPKNLEAAVFPGEASTSGVKKSYPDCNKSDDNKIHRDGKKTGNKLDDKKGEISEAAATVRQQIGNNLSIRDKNTGASDVKKPEEALFPLGNQELAEQAGAFAKSAAGSSMAAAADAFCRAAGHFAGGMDRKKRATETELSKSAMALFSVAQSAPSSEVGLAAVATELTCHAQMALLSVSDSEPRRWWRRASSISVQEAVTRPSFKQRLRAAISAPEPLLPIHAEDEKKRIDKRAVLYGLALGAPVAILTSAAGLDTFHGAWAWVAGASVSVWIFAATGMVLNQYAVLDSERLAAWHLGRLGVLGAVVLFCFFAYRAFFPSALWALWILLSIAAVANGLLWIFSCIRGDDVSGSARDAAGRSGQDLPL